MKDETGGVVIKEFVELKPKMYSFLVEDNSKHKNVKGENKNVEYKNVLLNKICLTLIWVGSLRVRFEECVSGKRG